MTTKIIGTVTLTEPRRFTQYSETASRTDYISCGPQTVPLRWDGYWLLARFDGTLESTSFPSGRTIGQPMNAFVQWSHAGFDPSDLRKHGFDVTVTEGTADQMGTYRPGTTNPGAPIMFYHPAVR